MPLKVKFFILSLLTFIMSGVCHAKTDRLDYDYNISGVSIAKEGNYLVEVSVTVDKKKQADIIVAKQYALLGCLYKGFLVDRLSQKPILNTPLSDKKKEDYVRRLILEDYNSYTSSTYPIQIVKVGKKYRVSAIILVAKEALIKNLENAGIIRKLGL